MTTWARISQDHLVDVLTVDPRNAVHGGLSGQFIVVPDGTLPGAKLVGGVWTNCAPQPAQTAPPVYYPMLHPMDFYLAFTPAERRLIKALASSAGIPASSTLLGGTNEAIPQDIVIAEFWDTYERSQSLVKDINPNAPSVQEGLAYLTAPTAPTPVVLAAGRAAQISAGVAQ
jgi:hypothetical protein